MRKSFQIELNQNKHAGYHQEVKRILQSQGDFKLVSLTRHQDHLIVEINFESGFYNFLDHQASLIYQFEIQPWVKYAQFV